MIRTFAPGTEGGDIEEYCPYCDNCIGIIAEPEDGYETVCPVCGNRLMLCTYCHDDFGDNCDWDDNGDQRCSKMCEECKKMSRTNFSEPILKIKLEDDSTLTGGISFWGETVEDFIADFAEKGHPFMKVSELNRHLVECGIKPILYDFKCGSCIRCKASDSGFYCSMKVSKTDFDDGACIWHIPKNEQNATVSQSEDHKWIPFTTRELTDEEKQEHSDWSFMLDCPLPDDGQEILISRNGCVFLDTYYYDGECYLDSGYTIEDGMAWMPLPEPYCKN